MPAALVILRIALATVFLAASFAKLSQRSSFAESLRGFGVGGDRAVAWLAVAIPGAEAVLGFALLPAASAWAAAVGMLVLLAVFTAAIVFNLLKGRRPSCNCFGQLGAKPISAGSVVRNAVLGVLAGWIVVRGQSHSGQIGRAHV